jgi:ring-1,2-phenylacetyl-CoA epoxidase subunit PaaC
VLSSWRLSLFRRLAASADPVLAAVAAKGVKELAYHQEYAAGWTVRLGDGTEYSHGRMRRAVDEVWPYVDELFAPDEGGFGVDPSAVRGAVEGTLAEVLTAATLAAPAVRPRSGAGGGRSGEHTEHLGPLLAELQSVARAHPGATW